MSKSERPPDFSLFLDILHTLEVINAPYMIDSNVIDAQVQALGEDLIGLWEAIKEAAEEERQKA